MRLHYYIHFHLIIIRIKWNTLHVITTLSECRNFCTVLIEITESPSKQQISKLGHKIVTKRRECLEWVKV